MVEIWNNTIKLINEIAWIGFDNRVYCKPKLKFQYSVFNLYSAFSTHVIKGAFLGQFFSDVIHITVYLTSYSWKQTRVLWYSVLPVTALLTVLWRLRLGLEPGASTPFNQDVDALEHNAPRPVSIYPSRKSSLECFVEFWPSPKFVITV